MAEEAINVNIQNREFVILPPGMDLVTKVGRMARICYRSEVKEGTSEQELNERVIRQCISSGHESVLEHGAISVAIPTGPCHDCTAICEKIDGVKGKRLNFRGLWESSITSVQAEYTMPFSDPDIETKHIKRYKIADQRQAPAAIPCILADIRAWRAVIRGKFRAAIARDDPYTFALALAVTDALSMAAPIFFEDVVREIDDFLKADGNDRRERLFTAVINKLEKNEKNLHAAVLRFFDQPGDIFAEPASDCATLSVIIHTDRATTHQLVRHRRDVGYSQESQRYVNYNKKGFEAMSFIIDPKRVKGIPVDPKTGEVNPGSRAYKIWKEGIDLAFQHYQQLVNIGVPPESARDLLPNACKTTIGVTWLTPLGFNNLMHWRVDEHAQFAIRKLFQEILLTAIRDRHPFTEIVSFDLMDEWLKQIRAQGFFNSTEAPGLIDMAEHIVQHNREEAEKIMKEIKDRQEQMEREAEKAREEARKNGGETPKKVIDLRKAKDVPVTPPEDVHEAAPTVQFLKGTEEKPAFPKENIQITQEFSFQKKIGYSIEEMESIVAQKVFEQVPPPYGGAEKIIKTEVEALYNDNAYKAMVRMLPWADGQKVASYSVLMTYDPAAEAPEGLPPEKSQNECSECPMHEQCGCGEGSANAKIMFPHGNLTLELADDTFVFHEGENLDTVKDATVDFINAELEAPFRGACKDKIVEKVRELVHAAPDYPIGLVERPWEDGQKIVEYVVVIGALQRQIDAPLPPDADATPGGEAEVPTVE